MSSIMPILIGLLFYNWQYFSTTGNYGNFLMGTLFIVWGVSNFIKTGLDEVKNE